MDVELVRTSVYSIPSKYRVGAIVFDGAADMQLWPGPGPDSDLREAWGDGLQKALDAELRQIEGRELQIPGMCRVHRGRLHCDFLLWLATRPPEPGTERNGAPGRKLLRESVLAAMQFVAERSVQRVAFPALGAGPDELDRVERLVTIVEATHAYHEQCFAQGRAPVVEHVLVCEPLGDVLRKAKMRVGRLAGERTPEPPKREAPAPKRRTGGTRAKKKEEPPTLTADDIAAARSRAEPFSIRRTYIVGDWLVHPKFGIGRVQETTPESAIQVLFEDGSQRKLAHGR